MIPLLTTDRAALLVGDSANLTNALPENVVDAIVCDPPAGVSFMGKSWDDDKGGRDAWVQWLATTLLPAFRALKPGGHALVWALPRTSHWTAWALELAGFEIRDRVSHLFGTGFPKSLSIYKAIDAHVLTGKSRPEDLRHLQMGDGYEPSGRGRVNYDHGCGSNMGGSIDTTAPATEEASQWEGWGTALKPACEDWWLVRKPLEGTYAQNVLKWGVGGLNIDGCRIHAGRWPAHLVLDQEAAAILDATQPTAKPKKIKGGPRGKRAGGFVDTGAGTGDPVPNGPEYGDAGGPSRFYYVTKPSKSEKNTGCEHLPVKSGGEATDRTDGSKGLQNPRAGAGRGGGAHNFHPTVKSIDLMRWLCRLVTPPGGVILDPFCGSGSTGVAALSEGFNFIGVEQSAEYAEIAKARLEHVLKGANDNE